MLQYVDWTFEKETPPDFKSLPQSSNKNQSPDERVDFWYLRKENARLGTNRGPKAAQVVTCLLGARFT